LNIEHLNSAESIPKQTGRNASLEGSPRPEDTARSLLQTSEAVAKPIALANQSSANFRSFLLNQREIDYRQTLKEIVNDYPIVQDQKQTLISQINRSQSPPNKKRDLSPPVR